MTPEFVEDQDGPSFFKPQRKLPEEDEVADSPERVLRVKNLNLQSSLENPLGSYISSRRSFAPDSPHFGNAQSQQLLDTPPSLSKEPFKQQLLDGVKKTTAHLLSFGNENLRINHSNSSKFTFQKNDESGPAGDLNFDSFHNLNLKGLGLLPGQGGFQKRISEKDSLIEEESKRDDLQNQQSTSEPKSSDIFASNNEDEEDLEELIATVSKTKKDSKVQKDDNPLFSGGSSHQASLASQKSQERKVRKFAEPIQKPDSSPDRHKMTMSSEFGNDLRNDMACYFSRMLERSSANSGMINKTSSEKVELEVPAEVIGSHSLSIKKVAIAGVRHSRDKLVSSKRSKASNSNSQKKRVNRERINLARSREDLHAKTCTTNEGSPKNSVTWRKLGTQQLVLKLDLGQISRSPRQTPAQDSSIINPRSLSNKAGIVKPAFTSRIGYPQSKSPQVVDKSSVLSNKPNLHGANKSQAALTTRELKKFMDKRKLTKTNVTDVSSNTGRSVIRLKSKKRLDKTPTIPEERSRPESVKKGVKELLEKCQPVPPHNSELRESKNSYLSDLFRDKSVTKVNTLRVSTDANKMGDQDKAKLRLMGDKHLEVTKCLTSRAKISFENTINSDQHSKVSEPRPEVLRRPDLTPERIRSLRPRLNPIENQNLCIEFTSSYKGDLPNGQEAEESKRVKIDLNTLSSKVLAAPWPAIPPS
jgi:hypothetical protein